MRKLIWVVLVFVYFSLKTSGLYAQGTFKLHENGVTIVCENVAPGDTGFVNGVTYTAVDHDLLTIKRDEGAELSGVCTSLVTNMANLFFELHKDFNDEIGNWDIGSVTLMAGMFSQAGSFDQNLASWDVSSVTDMNGIFANSGTFNQKSYTQNK
jgi:surface protein